MLFGALQLYYEGNARYVFFGKFKELFDSVSFGHNYRSFDGN